MITTYLIVAHLLSDFVLQPTKLIKWKAKSNVGVAFHVMIFFLLSVILLFPYLGNVMVLVVLFLICTIHFFTDKAKINIELAYDASSLPFVADQAIHYISLIAGGIILQDIRIIFPSSWFYESIYLNSTFLLILFGAIYFIYLINILFFQTHKGPKKHASVVTKVALFSIVYFVYFYTAVHLGS